MEPTHPTKPLEAATRSQREKGPRFGAEGGAG